MSDLALFKASPGTAVLAPVLFTGVATVTGIELLAQRFLALLIREHDAVFGLGTSLLAQVRGGAMSSAAMRVLVNLAVAQAAQQMPPGAAPEETLSRVDVLSVTTQGDHFQLSLRLVAQSAESTITTTTVSTV